MSSSNPLFQKYDVLYIFDSLRSIMLIPRLLEHIGGYCTVEAVYEENILEKAQLFLPNIIILDDVSFTDQLQFCCWLKANESTKHIPLIVVTTNPLDITQNRVIESGADVYLNAPIDIDEFSTVIKAYLS